ncbi:MAG: LemA family protein [Bacteroidales bacterium]|nr:LemA family protein [Bacteroidales bacterium]
MNLTILIFLSIAIISIFWFIVTHNKFIAKNNRVKQTESSISVMLKQRNDMIPNLVTTVQNYVGHENSTLTRIAELRSLMQQTQNEQEQIQLGTELSSKLVDIKVAVENYPELKADKQFINLFQSIEEMEYQLQAARRTFNAAAVDFNNYVQMFPSSIIASIKKYSLYELITIPETEKVNVDVKALFKS